MKTVASFSGGRSSAYMLIELIRQGIPVDAICFANTGKEREETLLFVKQVGEYLNRKIHWLEYAGNEGGGYSEVNFNTASRKSEPFEALLEKRKFLPNPVARFCTQELKIMVQKKFLMSLGWEHWISFVGIRYDEPLRWGRMLQAPDKKQRWDNELPMVEWQTTKEIVMDFWAKMPFDLQLKPHEGNCDLCFLKAEKKKLQIIRDNPEAPKWWIEQEQKYGATFRSNISVKQLVERANQPQLFDPYDIDFPCFCNAD